MIFSIICEELGIFGGIIVILLFIYILYRLFFIAQNAPDLYGSLMIAGVFAHLALQVILNICVVTNVIPTTGITLPFVSYGGTSLLFIMMEMAIALAVSRKIRSGTRERDLWGDLSITSGEEAEETELTEEVYSRISGL
jgi:cell division protein FtsW